MQEDLLGAVDMFCRSQQDKPGRPEAIRRILSQDLTRRGFLKSSGSPDEGKRPDDLDATSDD